MIGPLSSIQINHLLSTQTVGRIACHDENEIYIVPMSYAYDENNIYCHSKEGKKIEIMRKHPRVCFEVDETKNMSDWKSVICWGNFEEITDISERNKALKILLQRKLPILSSITTHLGEAWPFGSYSEDEITKIPGIVFRIKLDKKTGKFERPAEAPLIMFD